MLHDKQYSVILKDEFGEIIQVEYVKIKKSSVILRALIHDSRQFIVRLLNQNERMNVTDIYIKLRVEQSIASQHLFLLKKANVVTSQKNGKYIWYSLKRDFLPIHLEFVHQLINEEYVNFEESFNERKIEKAYSILRTLGHPLRLKMLKQINEQGEICVSELYKKMELEQSVTSQHLKFLRDANFVTTKKIGKQIFYHTNFPVISSVNTFCNQYLQNF